MAYALAVPNIMAFYMEALPNCTVENMSDKYWTCPTPGHIHPVLGEQVVMDDHTFFDRSGVCPCDSQSMLSMDNILDIYLKLNCGC